MKIVFTTMRPGNHSLGFWDPLDGWQGLAPGSSTLDDVIGFLGDPQSRERSENAEALNFWDGLLQITFLDEQPALCKIWISAKASETATIPKTLDQAVETFGPLTPVQSEKRTGTLYEIPGLRLCCRDSDPAAEINWFEFYSQ